MPMRAGTISAKLDSEEGARIRRALAAEQRVRLLNLLAKRVMNIREIAAELGVSQPTASVHISVLEDAGLVESEYVGSGRGSEKRCWATFDRLVFETESEPVKPEEQVEETAMPIGLFTSVSAASPCGLASDTRIIGFLDNPQSFLMPDRAEAQLLWFSSGWVEYTFPCNIPPAAEIMSIELVAELCSEAPNYDNEWASDITVWVNEIEIGTWTSPGDFGGKRGRLNPEWWSDRLTQHGALKTWKVNGSGSRVDGMVAGSARVANLGIGYQQPVVVRIGNKPGAMHNGGLNLFGRHFGNYPQDLILRISYKQRTAGQVASAVENLLGAEASAAGPAETG